MTDIPISDAAAPTLDAAQLAILAGFGERRAVAAGDVLFRDGDAGYDFFAVLSGSVNIIGTFDGVEESSSPIPPVGSWASSTS